MRRACDTCHIPLDGGRPIARWRLVSHGTCDTCGRERWPDKWPRIKAATGTPTVERWSGARLAEAMRKAAHSRRHLASVLGVSHARVMREARRPRLSAPLMKRLMGSPVAALYHGLTAPESA
jgi:hypothetical protein